MAGEMTSLIRAINSMSTVMGDVVRSNNAVVTAIKSTNEALNIGMASELKTDEVPAIMDVPHGTMHDLDAKRLKALAGVKSTEAIIPEADRAEIAKLSELVESVTLAGKEIASVTDSLELSSNHLLHTLTGIAEHDMVLKATTAAVQQAEGILAYCSAGVRDIVQTSSAQAHMIEDLSIGLDKAIGAITSASDGLNFNLAGASKEVDAMMARMDRVDAEAYKRALEVKEEIEDCSAEIRKYMAPMMQKIVCLEGKLSGIMSSELKISDVGGQSVTSSSRRRS
jgi:hypothetical protein